MDETIIDLAELTDPELANDLLEVIDASDTTMSADGTNKKIRVKNLLKPRVSVAASAGTLTPDANSFDAYALTAQAAALTIANATGTPASFQRLTIRILDNGTARVITFGTKYRGVTASLPITTIISTTLYLNFVYNAEDDKWDH